MLVYTVPDCIFRFCIEFAGFVNGCKVASMDIVESSAGLGMLNHLVLILQSGCVQADVAVPIVEPGSITVFEKVEEIESVVVTEIRDEVFHVAGVAGWKSPEACCTSSYPIGILFIVQVFIISLYSGFSPLKSSVVCGVLEIETITGKIPLNISLFWESLTWRRYGGMLKP